ncbi:uncharacterized protein LACBIDRAFT_318709 [Laccaria bicolor S238N-H82]|uniref:Predicted protein n=1 Tax=Laccaria bicolor (strain S238N-H82 / ATCC MYA-4686) TaxID=486041 RepID=B0D6V7_LACBS|nr:uncharacterized protein LACBIDRAFT_318709 [Laccaria bicolor S238N-H82]EDR09542.1 predicted protein [Laccaria bicolor S238N-H82]|eukprot:XP_001879891.1 predicted protein [Laccaria bicolor S238N-H82]
MLVRSYFIDAFYHQSRRPPLLLFFSHPHLPSSAAKHALPALTIVSSHLLLATTKHASPAIQTWDLELRGMHSKEQVKVKVAGEEDVVDNE